MIERVADVRQRSEEYEPNMEEEIKMSEWLIWSESNKKPINLRSLDHWATQCEDSEDDEERERRKTLAFHS